MPIYEFQCQNDQCESMAIYDHKIPITEPAEMDCAFCGEQMRKIYSVPAAIFKGGGFYSTDNR